MKQFLTFSTVLLGTVAVMAADVGSADQLKAAIAKLKAAPNYSYTAKTEMPGGQFRPGATTGKVEKGGFTCVSQEMGENTTTVFLKGDKAAVKVEDEWQLTTELEQGGGNRGGFMARFIARMKQPADEAEDLMGKVKELKSADGVLSGDLTTAAAEELLSFRRRQGGDNPPPPPKNAKGSVKFWLKDGQLTKYETYVEGTVTFREEERESKRTRTVEIQDVGSTKFEVPAEAKKKLSS